MNSGERPIGAAKGKQSDTEALCQPPPPHTNTHLWKTILPEISRALVKVPLFSRCLKLIRRERCGACS